TATLRRGSTPVPEATVQFFAAAPTNDWVAAAPTDSAGVTSFTFSSAGPIGLAAARSCGAGIVSTRVDSWTPELTLTTPDSTTIVNQPYRQTATLTRNGLPVSGASLQFRLSHDNASSTAVVATTDTNGRARVELSGDGESTNRISVDELVTAGN